jgi:hypothetical protein
VTLPPETLAALREAAARRADIARLVLVDPSRPRPAGLPAVDVELVVVLEEPPEAPDHELLRSLGTLLRPALRTLGRNAIRVPSPAGLEPSVGGGTVVYERGAPA